MSSRTARTLVAIAPDGQRVTLRTSGGYSLAGIVMGSRGWYIAEKGSSHESVEKRVKSHYRRNLVTWWAVVPLREIMPRVIEDYFASRMMPAFDSPRLRITGVFISGAGWITDPDDRLVGGHPGKSRIRQLRQADVSVVSVNGADFQMSELAR